MEREAAQEFTRQKVCAHLEPILDAQIAQACGMKFFIVRERATGRFLRRATKKDVAKGSTRTWR